MTALIDADTRTDLLNRLKRAEGQLRGIQRMLQEDQPAADIASQMSAVRKALDSTYVRMTVGYLEQEMRGRLKLDARGEGVASGLLDELQGLLAKVR